MKFRYLIPAVLFGLALSAHAITLAPEDALRAAQGNYANGGPMKAKADDMKLVYTLDGRQGPTLYVFTPAAADAKGFIIAAADDQVTPLLGYSDEGSFDPSNIPPQMQWLLESYSRDIEFIVANPDKASKMKLSARRISSDSGNRVGQRNAAHSAIAPLCATKWNQGSPYNDECPMVENGRSVTGCLATAMAQVMKYHNWPPTGTGIHTYSWDLEDGGQKYTYTDTFDFGNTTFDWSNMLNVYNSSASDVEKSAVAKLMHACGNAAEMIYSSGQSAGNDLKGAAGMINYLQYDPGMTVQCRQWYTADEWNDLVYGELSANRPVLYCGQSSQGGHAFVCDGYDGNGNYHINWGWGGLSDGYFLLADLNPYEQGIGGSSSEDGFNNDQTALVGCKKAEEGSTRAIVMRCSNLYTDAPTYNISNGTSVKISSDAMFLNFSTSMLYGIHVGFKLVNGNQTTYLDRTGARDLDAYSGYSTLNCPTTSFPKGSWKVYPAYSTDGQNWVPMYYDKRMTSGYLIVNVTDTQITVTETDGTSYPEPDPNPEGSVPATTIRVSMMPSTTYDHYYRGDVYTFTGTFTTNGSLEREYQLMLLSGGWVKAYGDKFTIRTETPSIINQQFNITLPDNLDLENSYYLAICDRAEGYLRSITTQNLKVERNPNEDGSAKVIYITKVSSPASGDYYRGKTYDVTYEFRSDGSFSNDYQMVLFYSEGGMWYFNAYSVPTTVVATEAGVVRNQFTITIPNNLDLSKNYYLGIRYNGSFLIWDAITVGDEPLMALYNRPAGCFYVPYSTSESSGLSPFDVPYIAVDPYSTVTFRNASTGAVAYNWSYDTDANGSLQNFTSANTDLQFGLQSSADCLVPELTATGEDGWVSTYQIKGATEKNGTPVALHLMASPNYPDEFDVDFDKHCWSSSKYFGASTDREGVADGALRTITLENENGELFGKNNNNFNGLATAFEAPESPYMIRALGVRFKDLALTGSGTPEFTMSIYKLQEIPEYADTESVEVVPGELLALKTVSVTEAYLGENLVQVSGKYEGLMPFPLDELVTVDSPILVTFTGYNSDAVASGFTAFCSADNQDEGYGELGYILEGTSGKWKGMNNVVADLASCKTAPSIFIEAERTFFNWDDESNEHEFTFSAVGQSATVPFHSSRGMENIKVTAPAWINVTMSQSQNADKTFAITATMTTRMLPASNGPKREVGSLKDKVVFNLNDTKTKEYGVNIWEGVVTGINDISDSREVESVRFMNMNGMISDKPFNGVNIVITKFTDGTEQRQKAIH